MPNSSNISENWLFIFHNQSGASLYLSFQDYVDSSNNFYHGVITNSPTIRESIDLKKSRAKSSNMNLTIPNFIYKGTEISEELFGGSNYYINRTVQVFSLINNSVSSNPIATFRLSDVSIADDVISLSLVSQKPWEFISIPQTKHPDYPLYEPVVYGNFTPASNANATGENVQSAYGTVFPVSVLHSSSDSIYTLMPRDYTTSDNAFIHHYIGFNQFLPLRLSESVFSNEGKRVDSITSTTIDNSGLNILKSRTHKVQSGTYNGAGFDGYVTTAPSDKEPPTTLQFFSNQDNMFKRTVTGALNDSQVSTALFNDNTGESFNMILATPKKELYFDNIVKILFRIKTNVGTPQQFKHFVFSNEFDSTNDNLIGGSGRQRTYGNLAFNSGTGDYSTDTGAITFNDTPSNATANNLIVAGDEILIRLTSIQSSSPPRLDNTLSIASCQLYYRSVIQEFEGDENPTGLQLSAKQDNEKIQEIKTFYCGGNGLKASWSGTPDITEIHEAHRDLLIRFAGMSTSTPNGYSDLDSTKNWKIRNWLLEPVELKQQLEKLQYEGGFIFRYVKGNESSPQYIYIEDSYSDSDITYSKTIGKDDLSEINIAPDDLSSLTTQMDISYQKHPSERGHLITTSAKNSTTRTNYNINTKENIQDVKLDAYVLPEIPTTPSSNPNDDFYSYYDNISGDIKININATIINPKFFDIDVGETIEFLDMYPSKAFGKSFDNVVFMVTSVTRGIGKVKFQAREIATIS
tara:strand:+ start:5818 stop:8058 length:2241 start_codon:yes stop_codon:yes gene_type:complete